MSRRGFTVYILALIYLTGVSIYWLDFGGANHLLLREFFYLSTSFIAAVGGFFSLTKYGLQGSRAKTIVFLTAGISCWFIGEVFFEYYQHMLHINPFPSIADFFYLVAYPLFFFGLINEIKSAHISWKKLHHETIFLLIIVSLSLAALVFYFGIFLAYDMNESLFTNSIAMSYGVGDLLLILVNIFVLVLVWEFRGGSLSRTWMAIFISFVLTLIADILFAMYTDLYKQQVWFYKSFLDSLWMLSYLFFAYGLFDFGFSIIDASEKIKKSLKLP